LQISFGWLFAIIAGAFILFLAIFAATKLINIDDTTHSAKTGKEIGILLNPLEIGFETGKITSFNIPTETRIYSKCNSLGNFGRQLIEISQKDFGKWKKVDLDVGFSNKYIFSENSEGKKFNIFSKPFNFPFKICDLVYLSSSLQNYCFVNAPESIKEEIKDLEPENFALANSVEECKEGDIKVCFGGGNCDIEVKYNLGYINKNGDRIYFEGDALMYAGIFSSSEVYECQLKRIMKRTKQLCYLYKDKAEFVSQKGCNSNVKGDLLQLINLINDFENSSDLITIEMKKLVNEIKEKNDLASCRLW